jgi:putative membrane protein
MSYAAALLAALIGALHVYIFLMESIWWGTPRVNRAFGVSQADAETNRLFAFNQGFYNLFLALAVFLGLVLAQTRLAARGQTLVDYAVASVLGAGAVLFFSGPRLRRPASLQGGPALVYLVLRVLQLM